MLFPYPGVAGGHTYSPNNHLDSRLAPIFLNRLDSTYTGQRFGLSPAFVPANLLTVRADITLNSDGSISFGANSQGVNDGNPGAPYVTNPTINGRKYLLLADVELVGSVHGGGTGSQTLAQRPGFQYNRCRFRSVGSPDGNLSTPETDTAWSTDPTAALGITTSLSSAIVLPQAAITVADVGAMAGVQGGPQRPGAGAPAKVMRIGAKGQVPQVVSYTSVIQNPDTTWTFLGCTGGSGSFAAGTRVCQGLDEQSGQIQIDNTMIGACSDGHFLYSGNVGTATGVFTVGASQPDTGVSLLQQFYFYQFCQKQQFRAGGGSGAVNIRLANGAHTLHPDYFSDNPGYPHDNHIELIRNGQVDNSGLGTLPYAQWIYFASSFGTAAFTASQGGANTLNARVTHCLFDNDGPSLWIGAGSSDFWAGYNWVTPQNVGRVDNATDSAFVEDRRLDTQALVWNAVPGPDDSPVPLAQGHKRPRRHL